MRTLRHTLAVMLTMLLAILPVSAQDVVVTVTPAQSVLPPQVMLYITEPSNYFNITLSNTGKDAANVYLVMQIEQVNPASDLAISTPPKRQPSKPFVVPAGGTYILTPGEMRGLFNHIPMSEIKAPTGLFDNYTDGSFGLLPEGSYELHITAYHWDPSDNNPYMVSSPSGGMAFFNVCYRAQAPQFLTPAINNAFELNALNVGELDSTSPMLTWSAPVITCNPAVLQYNYSIRIVEVLPGQSPDQSMDHNPVVYQASSLTTPTCMIPTVVVKQMSTSKVYAAQVTATSANVSNRMLNYVSIENEGKSTFRMFRLKSPTPDKEEETPEVEKEEDKSIDIVKNDDEKEAEKEPEDKGDGDKKDKEEKDEDEEDDGDLIFGKTTLSDSIDANANYTFHVPKIKAPIFSTSSARKMLVGMDYLSEWEKEYRVGGIGQRADTLKFEYELQIFDNGERANQEEALKQKPIFTHRIKEGTKDSLLWKNIEKDVEAGDYMVLRIQPICINDTTVAYTGDENVVDYALVNSAAKKYFQCSATTEIENTKPTEKKAEDLKGKQVSIGEYLLTIDEISGNGAEGFTGKGRVLWEPFGSKIMICVKFEKMKINLDDVVYEGNAVTYADPEMSNMDVVDKLFEDVDGILGDIDIPYSDYLKKGAQSGVKSIGESVNLGAYYKDLQMGKGLYSLITTGEMDNVHMPLKFPMEQLPKDFDVVDIQIANMTFAPTYATMQILGQAKLPECDALKSKMLVFGAPRVCISPNRFLPESGHIALLGDFTLTPTADFELTFKAPENILEPTNGCYISWHADTLELLGIDAEMTIPGLVKDKDGVATEETPVLKLQASIGSWDDFLVDEISIDPFQVVDLPGYTFTAKDIVYDHSDFRNSKFMSAFPEKYSKSEAGIKGNDESWHGLHIGDIGVKFPKSLEFGTDGKERLSIHCKEMFLDNSGVTLTMEAQDVFAAKEGKLGGWGISLDKAHLQIIQNDFDNCMFAGQLNVPLFGKKGDDGEQKEGAKEDFGNINYTCEIRRLTDPRSRSKNDNRPLERTRYSYVFLTEQVKELNFNCFVAQATLDSLQTYFLIEAEDDEKEEGKINTQVELCMGGTIGIGGVDKANAWLKEKTASLPLEVKIPDIHFTKMRLSNVKRAEWKSNSTRVQEKRKAREEREKAVEQELRKNLLYYKIAESEEMALGQDFYLDLGEWSLASAKKRIGPFSFSLDKFTPSYKDSKIEVEVGGTMGLLEDKINVGATLGISAKLDMPGSDISNWSISDGDIEFRGLNLDLDFTALHLKGELELVKEGPNKGYSGDLTIDVKGLFALECEGGYFEHAPDETSEKGMKEEGIDTKELDEGDRKYSWGYFMVKMESSTGIRIDPVVITRISGGFFFNCRPTEGEKEENSEGYNINKFSGKPEACYGNIGVALGVSLASSAGKETLSGDMDLLVCYDRENSCLSTFMFNGKLRAIGNIIKADASLIYENQKSKAGKTINRYLCLNVTVEAGVDTKELMAQVSKANSELAKLKEKLDDFQKNIDGVAKMVENPTHGLKQLSGDYDKNENGAAAEGDGGDENESVKEMSDEDKEVLGATAMKTKISLEFKITWAKEGKEYPTPRWHLYLGEPAKDKRCSFTYLKFDGKIVHVDIGADAYLCIGNELPDNGALPPIPSEITEFLSGHKSERTDMGGDLGKAERSRKRAAQAMLGDNINGGVMVGASAWGKIDIDLGLLYGKMHAIAGFDVSMINYGNSAFCVNSGSAMGKNGWYAMGQFYALLEAELGIHVKIGSLIDERIAIFSAGIGGVLEMGLPNPTWVEGQARIKISLLGGLCKINKKFEFSAGDHCVPFKGNALDGFEMFQDVSLGSDSIYQALMDPTFAISKNEANNMTFNTTSSIGSHYRLLDPSWADEMVERDETTEEDVQERIAMNASRTYVFDLDQNLNENNMKMGVRLFDLGTEPTEWATSDTEVSEADFMKKLQRSSNKTAQLLSIMYGDRSSTVSETSTVMSGKDLTSKAESTLKAFNGAGEIQYNNCIDYFLNPSLLSKKIMGDLIGEQNERNVSFRESKGTTFHLTNMDVKPGHSYVMFLMADAYEIENGKRIWCSYVDTVKNKEVRIHWKQTKAWFFRVKSDEEEKIVTDSLRDLQPYIALAYPSIDGSRVVDRRGEGTVTAYYQDIMYPTIALNRDLQEALPANKMQWVLTGISQGDTIRQTRDAKYVVGDNCVNLEANSWFSDIEKFNQLINVASANGKSYDFNNELYHLELQYKYSHKYHSHTGTIKDKFEQSRDSVFNLVDLWLTPLPRYVNVDGKEYTDSWLVTTTRDNAELLPYSYPFVGARIDAKPVIDYESDYRGRNALTDVDHVFNNTKYTPFGKPYRLIDPYLYFAYLGKWVFIGDREINPYDFDEVGCKFASESLIFNYNGTVVNCEFLKDKTNKSLYSLRNKMYNVWNDWHYQKGSSQPEYPLPMTAKTVGGLTVNNQDGKASTVTPLNVNHYKDFTFCFQDLVKDYTAVYDVADQLCNRLNYYSSVLVNKFFKHVIQKAYVNSGYAFNDSLNKDIKAFTQEYRGRYIDIESRGYNVRVPFYQLPLIYGDCFGADASYGSSFDLDGKKRTFSTSIGEDDMRSGDAEEVNLHKRWHTEFSNLFFFRLNDKGTGFHLQDGYNMAGRVYDRYKNQNNASYVGGTGTSMEVEWDNFDKEAALRAVSDFRAILYRVDAYDIDKGLYTIKNRGAGPWKQEVSINASNGTANNLEAMTTAIADQEHHLKTHYDQPRIQAVRVCRRNPKKPSEYITDKSSLIFLYTDSIYKPDQLVNGLHIWTVYDEPSEIEKRAWRSANFAIVKCVIDPSMAKADIRDLSSFFEELTKVEEISGFENLNTSKVTNMSRMFYDCRKLTSLDLRALNTKNVKNMSRMFESCESLTNLDMTGWDTGNVTDMSSMFSNCQNLKTLQMKFNTKKVTSMRTMFADCSSLEELDLTSFTSESLENMTSMFNGCKAIKTIDFRETDCEKATKVSYMFRNCENLRNLYINRFVPENVGAYKQMFDRVPNTLHSYISYDLDDRIKSQIPGIPSQSYDDAYQALHLVSTNGSEEIFYLVKASWNVDVNSNIFVLDRSYKVKKLWRGKAVMGIVGQAPNWSKEDMSKVTRVIIDKTFKQSPGCMMSWFCNFTSLESVEGLEYLNLKRTSSLGSLFKNCKSLNTLTLPRSFKTDNITGMSSMFDGCESLTELKFETDFNTEKVDAMSNMFRNCKSLREINLPYEFTCGNVSSFAGMFQGCTQLETISQAGRGVFAGIEFGSEKYSITYKQMFAGCTKLKDIDLSNVEVSRASDLSEMFKDCSSLKELDLHHFKTSGIASMTSMFEGCTGLQNLNLSNFTSEKLKNYDNMFKGVPTDCVIYIPYDFNSNVLSQIPNPPYRKRILIYPAYVIQYNTGGTTELRFFGSKVSYKVGDTYNGYRIEKMWSGTQVIDRSGYNLGWNSDNVVKVTIEPSFAKVPLANVRSFFSGMKSLTSIEGLENLNTSYATSMGSMFYNCAKLTSLPGLEKLSTQYVTDMSYMFSGCSSLQEAKVFAFNTTKVTDMTAMFSGCRSLKSLNLKYFNTPNVTKMSMMFNGCSSLTSLDLGKNFDVSNVQDGYMFSMFDNCSNLTSLDLSNFRPTKQSDMLNWFANCSSLESLDLSSMDLSKMKRLPSTFAGCTSLRKLVVGSLFNTEDLETLNGVYGQTFKDVHDMIVITPADRLEAIRNAFVEKLGFVEGVTGTFYDKEPSKEAQVIWTPGNKTLTFYYGVPVGDYFNGQTVNKKWTGNDVLATPLGSNNFAPWCATVAEKAITVVFDNSFVNVPPTKTNGWFCDFQQLTEIEGLNNLNTTQVTDMSYMFYRCYNLPTLDLSNFNTENVTNMKGMFYSFGSKSNEFKGLDVSTFNTSKVTNMSNMFGYYTAERLDLTSFNTTSVNNVDFMFRNFRPAGVLRVGANFTFPRLGSKSTTCFNSVKGMQVEVHSSAYKMVRPAFLNNLGFVENTHGKFIQYDKKVAYAIWCEDRNELLFVYTAESITKGTKFLTRRVTAEWHGDDVLATPTNKYAPWIATVKAKLRTVTFDKSFAEVTPTCAYAWFADCENLQNVDGISNLNTSKMKNMFKMFYNCSSLKTVDVSGLNTSNVQTMSSMFAGCKALATLDVSNFDTKSCYSMNSMFEGCKALTTLDVSNFDTKKVTDMRSMFYNCSALTALDVSKFQTQNVNNMNYMFYNCSNLTELNVRDFITSNVTTMQGMFRNCSKVTSLMTYYFNTSKVKNMSYMFYGCESLTSVRPENFNTSNVTNMSYMFYHCLKLSYLNLEKWNTSNVTDMSYMFAGCAEVSNFNIGKWNTSKVTNMAGMFKDCAKWYWRLDVRDLDVSNVTNMSFMFSQCVSLEKLDLSKWNTANVTKIDWMLDHCTSLKNITLSKSFKTDKLNAYMSKYSDKQGVFNAVPKLTVNLSNDLADKTVVIQSLKTLGFKSGVTGYLKNKQGQTISF